MNDDLCLWSVRWTAGSKLPIRRVDHRDGWILVECLGVAPEDRVWMRASILAGADATVRRMVDRDWPDHDALTVWLRLSVHQGRTSVSWVAPADEELGIVSDMVARANAIAEAEDRVRAQAAEAHARAVARSAARDRRREEDRLRRYREAMEAPPSPGGRAGIVLGFLRSTPMVTGSTIADLLGWDRIKTHLLLLKMAADGLTVRNGDTWRSLI